MVVSSSIADHRMNVDKYFMFNAAVQTEAFDETRWNDTQSSDNLMAHYQWLPYTNLSWSAKWHEFFANDILDDRGRLTWKNRFTTVPSKTSLYNYYSTGDEVLELFFGTPNSIQGMQFWDSSTWGRYAWHKQETHKGRGTFDPGGTPWTGWGLRYNFTYARPAVTSSWSGVNWPRPCEYS